MPGVDLVLLFSGLVGRVQRGAWSVGRRAALVPKKVPGMGWCSPTRHVLGANVKLPSTSPWPRTQIFSFSQNLSPDKIFHVVVAPCYDKKLEALRDDFPSALRSSRGADCVLTSGERRAGLGTGGLQLVASRTSGGDGRQCGKDARNMEGLL